MKMKLFLFLCISLTLGDRGFARNIELLSTESTFNSSENTAILSPQSTLNMTKNTVMLNTENTLNSTEDTVMPNTESTLDLAESTTILNSENTSILFENTATTEKSENKCPEDMLSFPWRTVGKTLKCYCEYPFFPLPMNDTCYELFRQGPCELSNFLIQPLRMQEHLPLPRCAANPCLEDGLIPFNGTCHDMITHPICEFGNLYYRETTSEVTCRLLVTPRTSINAPFRRTCPIGSRKDRNGRCRRML